MKKKRLLLVAVIAVIAACVFVLAVVLPNRPGVTKANFDRIKMGMTRAEVVEIFGVPPLRQEVDPNGRIYEAWDADNLRGSAWVEFQRDRVANCSWLFPIGRSYQANATYWDRLRRWVGLK